MLAGLIPEAYLRDERVGDPLTVLGIHVVLTCQREGVGPHGVLRTYWATDVLQPEAPGVLRWELTPQGFPSVPAN